MSIIQAAITKVSTERSKLGALQNRLEHTINNLDTTSENTQAAESRIRDTDMASEMVEYSKNNNPFTGWTVNACSGKSVNTGSTFTSRLITTTTISRRAGACTGSFCNQTRILITDRGTYIYGI